MEQSVLEQDLYFLLLHQLALGPCREAAAVLELEAAVHGLLPLRVDVHGHTHELTYQDLQKRYSHIAPNTLTDLLSQLLGAKQASNTPNACGITSLLHAGSLAALPGVEQSSLQPAPPPWLASPHRAASAVRMQQLRSCGVSAAARSPGVLILAERLAANLQHQKTVRGHRSAVYCTVYEGRGRWLITGADDRLLKIWGAETALLKAVCKGHEAELTDLAVSADNAIVASSSMDWSIRCWSLQEAELGHPKSVLLGHEGPVTFVDFNSRVPTALLSASMDGTCRIWHATSSQGPIHVLQACPAFSPQTSQVARAGITRSAAIAPSSQPAFPNGLSQDRAASAAQDEDWQPEQAGRQQGGDMLLSADQGTSQLAEQDANGLQSNARPALMVCSFSPDADYIVAGATDCSIYVWSWDTLSAVQASVAEVDSSDSNEPATGAAWHQLGKRKPQELCKLEGHKNDVMLLQFSPDGKGIATGSKDGTVRIWRRPRRRALHAPAWQQMLVLACPPDEAAEAIKAARRLRRAATNPGVHQLTWTVNSLRIIAAVTDNSVRVWDAYTGVLLHRLSGHSRAVHVLEAHPWQPGLVLSGSYDGTLNIWDIAAGHRLTSFSTRSTKPGYGAWADAIELVDGHWSKDGSGLIVSDVAGQWHVYGMGPTDLMQRSRYDQFLTSEWHGLMRDTAGNVLDIETQQAPHIRSPRELLVDIQGHAYPDAYQTLFFAQRLGDMSIQQAQAAGDNSGDADGMPQSLLQAPPVLAAASWRVQEAGGDQAAIDRAVHQAAERNFNAERDAVAARAAAEAQAAGLAAGPDQQRAASVPQRTGTRGGREGSRPGVTTRSRRDAFDSEDGDSEDRRGSNDDVELSSSTSAEQYSVHPAEAAQQRAERAEAREQRKQQGQTRRRAAAGSSRQQKRRRLDASSSMRLRGRRSSGREDSEADSGQSQADAEDEEEETHRRRSQRKAARRAQDRLASLGEDGADFDAWPRSHQHSFSAPLAARRLAQYSWLQGSEHRPGVYVPQMEDEVVYMWQGHEIYLAKTMDKRQQRPWDMVSREAATRGARIRPCEPALVLDLRFAIADDGQSNTIAVLKLQLSDPDGPLHGRQFELELPSPDSGHAEFVVLRTRFEAALDRNWQVGDQCEVRFDDVPSTATIVEDRAEGAAGCSTQTVWDRRDLWERFELRWRAGSPKLQQQGEAAEDEPPATDCQSPWEMFDVADSSAASRRESPAVSDDVLARCLSSMDRLQDMQRFKAFCTSPKPTAHFMIASVRRPYNAVVALPLALETMIARLEEGYYRQAASILHDARVIASNAALFNGPGSELAADGRDLEGCITAAVQGRDWQLSDSDNSNAEDEEPAPGPADDMQQADDRAWGFRAPRSQRNRPSGASAASRLPADAGENIDDAGGLDEPSHPGDLPLPAHASISAGVAHGLDGLRASSRASRQRAGLGHGAHAASQAHARPRSSRAAAPRMRDPQSGSRRDGLRRSGRARTGPATYADDFAEHDSESDSHRATKHASAPTHAYSTRARHAAPDGTSSSHAAASDEDHSAQEQDSDDVMLSDDEKDSMVDGVSHEDAPKGDGLRRTQRQRAGRAAGSWWQVDGQQTSQGRSSRSMRSDAPRTNGPSAAAADHADADGLATPQEPARRARPRISVKLTRTSRR